MQRALSSCSERRGREESTADLELDDGQQCCQSAAPFSTAQDSTVLNLELDNGQALVREERVGREGERKGGEGKGVKGASKGRQASTATDLELDNGQVLVRVFEAALESVDLFAPALACIATTTPPAPPRAWGDGPGQASCA